jgi:opacity protein-like surface antigen
MIRIRAFAFVGLIGVLGAANGATDAVAQFYVSGNFGGIFPENGETEIETPSGGAAGTAKVHAEYKTGFAATGAVGYGMGNGRLELEVSYRHAEVDRFSGSDSLTVGGVTKVFPASASDTDLSALAFMANAWYDFETGTPWRPFAGAGFGGARVNMTVGAADTGFASDFDDSDIVFAFQVGLGIGYEITKRIRADLSYRYFTTSQPSLQTTIAGTDVSARTEIDMHNLFAGLTVKF